MDSQRRGELWAIALENFRASRLAMQRPWYNVSASRRYYAAYTTMWLALGDPPPYDRWKHEGITRHFALGQWKDEPQLLARELRKALTTLYKYRLKADYHGLKVTADEARQGLATATTVLAMVAEAFHLPKRGISA